MGFVKGREIEALLQAPMHDPVKYSLMGYEVSLRRAEANMIEIVPLEESGLTDESSHTNTLIEKVTGRLTLTTTVAERQST